ncbi:MAG: class I tRNA ligase family protein, partial [Clostridia bacterium]|nr:class I tRNA ligase family protein [Clostridia bacterium]
KTATAVLAYVLTRILRLLHPFMPFITEEIYGSLHGEDESIMVSPFPAAEECRSYPEEAEATDRVLAAIRAIRTRRAEMNVPPSRRTALYIVTPYGADFTAAVPFFERLAGAAEVKLTDTYRDENAVSIVTDAATVYIPLADMIDFEKERARLTAELARAEEDIARTEKKLANESFVAKAPAAVVDAERAKLEKFRATRESLLAEIAKLG